MKFNWIKATITFFLGLILSLIIGGIFNDGGMASATAACYVGAIIVGIFSKKEDE